MRKLCIAILATLVLGLILMPLTGIADTELKGKVAVILDVGGRGDLSFNDMGFKGTDEAADAFGLEMTEMQSASADDYLSNVRNAAREEEFDLIICVGFLLGDALATVAPEFPDQKFAIIDVDWVTGPNIMNVVFSENEGSALVGALAGAVAAYYGYYNVGVVLGIEIPVLYHFEAGYRFGIDYGLTKYAEFTGETPDIGLLWKYTGSFSDTTLGYETTNAQLSQGAGLVFNVAGPLGIGDLQAITDYLAEKGEVAGPPFMVGVDANQDWMGDGNRVLASMMKRVDVGCYTAVQAVVEGTFEGGVLLMDLSNSGIAMSGFLDLLNFMEFGIGAGEIADEDKEELAANWARIRAGIPVWIWNMVADLEKAIISGDIVVPTANTVDEMKAVRVQYPLE